MPERSLILNNEMAVRTFGAALAGALGPGDVICLKGPLGAGKTTLARGVIKAFASAPEVPSPTFTLVETYEGPQCPLWHFDLYRLDRPDDVWELGFEDALNDGICLIEWPERISDLLPAAALTLAIIIGENNTRKITLSGSENWMARLIAANIL